MWVHIRDLWPRPHLKPSAASDLIPGIPLSLSHTFVFNFNMPVKLSIQNNSSLVTETTEAVGSVTNVGNPNQTE